MLFSNHQKIKRGLALLCLCTTLVFSSSTTLFALKPADSTPPVPISDAALRQKEVGITVFGITLPGATLDKIMIEIVKNLLEQFSDSTVKWINGGFQGSPAYAVDPRGFLEEVGTEAANILIKDLQLDALCSPFNAKIKLTVDRLRLPTTNARKAKQYACTLDSVVKNVERFVDGSFAEGGWDGWFELTQTSGGNPYLLMLNAQADIASAKSKAQSIESQKLDWANGFFSFSDECDSKTETSGICLGRTKTPGKVIEAQLQNVLGSEINQLELADEFDELLSAMIGQLVGRVFSRSGIIQGKDIPPWSSGGLGKNHNSLSAYCYGSANEALAGEEITWTAVSTYQNSSFSWSGDEFPANAGNTNTVKVTYTTAGLKKASIVVTGTKLSEGKQVTETTGPIQCTPPIQISLYSQIGASCIVDNKWGNIGDKFTFSIRVSGGSPTKIYWGWADAKFNGIPGFDYTILGEKINASLFAAGFPLTGNSITVSGSWDGRGSRTIKLVIMDSDRNVEPRTVTCPFVQIL
jgi:hypothetical protein